MGQKVNPKSIRLLLTKDWHSKWFAGKSYADQLHSDLALKKAVRAKLGRAGIARVDVERFANAITVVIHTSKPGVVIGRSGKGIEELKAELERLAKQPIKIQIEEERKPELSAQLVAENIAGQLERRIAFRRALRQAAESVMRAGAKGVKARVSGRLGGADMSRVETVNNGSVPLSTFKAAVDYAQVNAHTTYGVIGVKVWIYRDDIDLMKPRELPTDEGMM